MIDNTYWSLPFAWFLKCWRNAIVGKVHAITAFLLEGNATDCIIRELPVGTSLPKRKIPRGYGS
jgi:hypothetical protein